MGYFDEHPLAQTPPVPPTPAQAPMQAPVVPPPVPADAQPSQQYGAIPGAPPPPPPPAGPPQEWVGLPVRAGGDRIFLLRKGLRHWISTAEVYGKLGFKFGDEVKIDQETLAAIPEGEILR